MIKDIDHTEFFPRKYKGFVQAHYHLTLDLLINADKVGYFFPKMVDAENRVMIYREDYLVENEKLNISIEKDGIKE